MTPPINPILSVWKRRLDAAASLTLAPDATPDPATFRDEMGHRRAVDGPFLAATTAQPLAFGPRPQASADELLWHAAAGTLPVERVPSLIGTAHDGPLYGEAFAGTVEVFTESQLCAVHALHLLAMRYDRADWLDAAMRACRWMQDNLQPDNATNHPWGVHVFLLADARGVTTAGTLYADSMLMNCQVNQGRPDSLSAYILRHAASCLP